MIRRVLSLVAAVLVSGASTLTAAAPDVRATACERLVDLTIPAVVVERADEVAAGALADVPGVTVKGHCRVIAIATPVDDSRIRIEIWIPTDWNGKLLGTGNGGFSGSLSYRAMVDGLNRGYAVAGTNTGHDGESMDFGIGHPEKIVDWAHRAIHVMTETAKLVVRNHRGAFPSRAYFSGCSTGGQQALSEAQRYPGDYDGIVAGDPGNNRLRLIYGFLWSWLATHDDIGEPILPSSKLPGLADAVMRACDAKDGLKDGLIAEPGQCRFDARLLTCKGPQTDACLTPRQVEAVNKLYAGPRHPKTGERIFAGWARGSELGWREYITDPREPVRVGLFRGWVFHNPHWDPRSFDWDRDIVHIDATLPFLDATSTDLSRFRRGGGKLLMYTGLADPVVPPQDTIDYYERAATASGGMTAARTFFRFFPVPGMGHCGGGIGPNRFDALSALEAWTERGVAPDRIVAEEIANENVVRSRPLCAWPTRARFRDVGDAGDARQFVCEDPNHRPRRLSRRR